MSYERMCANCGLREDQHDGYHGFSYARQAHGCTRFTEPSTGASEPDFVQAADSVRNPPNSLATSEQNRGAEQDEAFSIAEPRRICEAAYIGPWSDGDAGEVYLNCSGGVLVAEAHRIESDSDLLTTAAFIAHARTALPAALAALEAAQFERDEARRVAKNRAEEVSRLRALVSAQERRIRELEEHLSTALANAAVVQQWIRGDDGGDEWL